jgi:hypothetical protein
MPAAALVAAQAKLLPGYSRPLLLGSPEAGRLGQLLHCRALQSQHSTNAEAHQHITNAGRHATTALPPAKPSPKPAAVWQT